MTDSKSLTWTCPKLPENYRKRLGNRRVAGYWFRHDHPTSPRPFEPDQPYVFWVTALTSDMVRPADLPDSFANPGSPKSRDLINQMIVDIVAAQRRLPCVHRNVDNLLWRWGSDGLDFYPCEAVALFGDEKADRFFDQVLTELMAVRYRTSLDSIIEG